MATTAVSWLLSAPPGPKRVRPDEIIYGIDERPPAGVTLAMAAQHAVLVLMLTIYGVIAARSIGLGALETVRYTSACICIFGLGSILQGLRSRLTPGVLLVNIPSPLALGAYVSIIEIYGLGAAMGAIITSNAVILGLVRFLPRMRGILPPEVVGVVVLMLGMTLIPGGVTRSVGLDAGPEFSVSALAVALVTLAGVIAASVWGSGRVRLLAVLIGATAGAIVAGATGHLDFEGVERLAALPLFEVPVVGLDLPMPRFVPAAVLGYLVVELLHAMDQMACALTIDKLNDKNWRRADMSMVSRAVIAMNISNILQGAAGIISGGSSSANIGLAHASGVMARHIAVATGLMMIAVSFVPTAVSLIVLTPEPVIGGILVYTAAFMIVAGMDLILSRMLNTKRSFTVGLSIVVGASVIILPQMVEDAPEWSRTIVGSGLTVAALAAVSLNAIFRIGVRQTATIVLPEGNPAAEAAEFLERNGKAWGARREVIARAGIAIGEALEILQEARAIAGPVSLTARFDEVNLVCSLEYAGTPPALARPEDVDLDAILLDEDDSSLEAGMMQVSSMLVTRLADRVTSSGKGGRAVLTLSFDH